MLDSFCQDADGNSLPADDESPWNPCQKYVWEKSKSRLDQKVQDEFDAAVKNKDKKLQYRIVNAHVPKNASYSMILKGDCKVIDLIINSDKIVFVCFETWFDHL